MSKQLKALAARVDLLSIALQNASRALAPAQADQVAMAVRAMFEQMACTDLAAAADEGMTADLAPLLATVGRSTRMP